MTTADPPPPTPNPNPARHRQHDSPETPVALRIVLWVAGALLVLVLILLLVSLLGNNDESPAPSPTLRSVVSGTPIHLPPTPSATAADLVARARQIKPLEDIHKGDRVLYQGSVCTWQLWDKDITTSTIKCPGAKAFQIQTGRLTPVELKTGPSALKVRH